MIAEPDDAVTDRLFRQLGALELVRLAELDDVVASLAATVVVEAGIRSGSMSVAQRAHELAHAL